MTLQDKQYLPTEPQADCDGLPVNCPDDKGEHMTLHLVSHCIGGCRWNTVYQDQLIPFAVLQGIKGPVRQLRVHCKQLLVIHCTIRSKQHARHYQSMQSVLIRPLRLKWLPELPVLDQLGNRQS